MVKTMLKKFLCIFFSLVACCMSLVVPCSYAEDDFIYDLPSDYYYYGNSDYIDSCFNFYSSFAQYCLSKGKTVYNDFFISYSSEVDKATIYLYDSTPVFEFYSDYTSTSGFVEYRSQDLKWHTSSFTVSSGEIIYSSVQFDYSNNRYPYISASVYSDGSFLFKTGGSNLPSPDLIISSFDFEGFESSSGGAVNVTFLPAFSMNMNGDLYNSRLGFGGSTSSTGSHLSMIVESKLKNPIQIRMYITGKGEKFSLGEVSAGPTHTGFQNRNWNCDFIFMKEDWVFAPDISTGDTSNSRLQYKPTSWHYVDTYFNQSISWASINVIEDEEYDVVVEYVELAPDDIYADTTLATDDKIIECYRQTFSIYKRSVAYDPTNEDFGVLNIHGYDDYLTAENSSSGYVDDDGKTQIKNTLNVNPNLYGNGSSGSGSHQLYSGTNFSLTSLQMSTRNVLSFFQYVFGYFPSQVWNAFYFILVCIVVFAFIKLLKG